MSNFIHSMLGFNHRVHKSQISNTFKYQYFEVIKDILENGNKDKRYSCLDSVEMVELFINHMDPISEATVEDLSWKLAQF